MCVGLLYQDLNYYYPNLKQKSTRRSNGGAKGQLDRGPRKNVESYTGSRITTKNTGLFLRDFGIIERGKMV